MNFLSLIIFLLTFSLHAGVIEGPLLGTDFSQNPSSLEWKHIRTEHFDIIFPSGVENDAQRVAHLLEKAYPYVTQSLEVSPPRIPLILQNQSMVSNGFVTLAPRRSEWYMTPATDPELTNTEWLKTLSVHEFRHVVQFEKSRQGFNKILEYLLGQIGQALGLALTSPPWYFEGDAVGIETALTKGGRGRLPLFERDLRTLLLSGKKWNYDKAHLRSYKDYVPNHYVYGYFYTSWMKNQYGNLFLSKLINRSAERSYNPLSFYNATESFTGESFEKFYDRVMNDLIAEWKKRADALTLTPYKVHNLTEKFGWTNYYYPQFTQDGKILALKRGLSFINQFVLIDGKKEKTVLYPAAFSGEYPFKLRGNKLVYFELDVDPRWGYRDFNRLKVYDLSKEEFVLDKRRLKGRLAIPDHEGQQIAYVEWDEHQEQSVVIIDQMGKEVLHFSWPRNDVITSLDWINQSELVLVTKDFEDQKGITKINITAREKTVLLPKGLTNIGNVTVEDGHIFYESPRSGIDNIFLLTEKGPQQLTSALFGSYAPDLQNGKMIYNDYTASGMNVVEKDLFWKEEQKSEDSFYPLYEKFAKSEQFTNLQSDYVKKEEYKISPYSQVKNALNFHSWVILAPPLSSTVTLMGISRDVLNKLTLVVGGDYNLNEQTTTGFVSSLWSHYYPVFDLRAAYGTRKQNLSVGGENKWEEGTFEGGVSVPWRYLQGRFTHSFTARAFSKIIKVTNKVSSDLYEVSNGALFSPGAHVSYSLTSRMAQRDINPQLGLTLDAHEEEGRDITGTSQKGSLTSLDGKLYLPGAWYHHSFFHQLAYERQRDETSQYKYASYIFYPRGTRNIFLQEFTKYSANYLMPLFYPDYNLSRYLYFKRISLNLFYDELHGRFRTSPYKTASTGWETTFEMNFVRIFLPISIGVRGSYVLYGNEKSNNYEVFLASTLASY